MRARDSIFQMIFIGFLNKLLVCLSTTTLILASSFVLSFMSQIVKKRYKTTWLKHLYFLFVEQIIRIAIYEKMLLNKKIFDI